MSMFVSVTASAPLNILIESVGCDNDEGIIAALSSVAKTAARCAEALHSQHSL